ncbi:MAG: integrating conjugative element protein [Betaproteobacteria bacterium]|nr:integrating conjugative element protein [Betaproteobacteria bacterium]
MKKTTLLIACALVSGFAQAANTHLDSTTVSVSGNVIGDELIYSIGGGRAVSFSPTGNYTNLMSVGLGWNSNLICGDMSITTTIKNQLNGITNGFQTLMSSVIQNATSAVASLPAMIIQRAYPALYNLLTNGILQGRLDFDRSKLTCRAIGEKMMDIAGGQSSWNSLSEGFTLNTTVSSGNQDAVSAVETAETNRGNTGVTWIGGTNAGGASQPPVKVVNDVARAGFNLLTARSATDTSTLSTGACANRIVCQTWSSPTAAAQFATRVLGERIQRTCDSCTKTETTPGEGLMAVIQEEYEAKLQSLANLVSGTSTINATNLERAGSNYLPVTRSVIEALRDEPDQDALGKRLASEVALSSTLEKALLLERMLRAGKKEPNVSANEMAMQAVDQEIQTLTQEIASLKAELELRHSLTGNAALAIVQRKAARAAASGGVFEGDTTRDRVKQIERP